MNSHSLVTGRIFAAVFAILLSATMVVGSVGPAVQVQGPAQTQGTIA
ncbi:MAG TPA: hypothetical protein VFF89_04125 [Sphingobium sp.]|nr:hypothetical protein [Sphingobium sp.]